MRFLDEQGVAYESPPAKAKGAKAAGEMLWVMGLEWQAVSKGSWAAAAREIAAYKPVKSAVVIRGPKRDNEAGKQVTGQQHLGLLVMSFKEDEELKIKVPRRAHSLAAVFALSAQSQGAGLAALYLDIRSPEGASSAYFCRLFNGIPTTDLVRTKEQATELAQDAAADGCTVFSNDQDLLPGSTPIDLSWFASATDKLSLMRSVPFNWTGAMIGAAVLVALVGGGLLYQKKQADDKKRAAAVALAAADPLPKYQAALLQQRKAAGMDGPASQELFRQLMRMTTKIDGWRLTKLECEQVCIANWERTNGTFAGLVQQRASDKVLVPAIDEQGRPATTPVNSVRTQIPIKPVFSDVPMELPKYDGYVLAVGNTYQKWANAGLSTPPIQVASTWPSVPGAAGLVAPSVIARGTVVLGGINAVFGSEVLGQIQPNVLVKKMTINVGVDSLRLDITGDFYVAK